ncbi:hypothetical protein N9112_00100 [bacterium]|nr:hypothetical protein [bacterium]
MSVVTNLAGADTYVLQEAISGYSDEAYTNARKLSGTGIVGSNSDIDKNTETFVGQLRWNKPINPQINVASLTDSADGDLTTYSTDYLRYIKTVRTHGAMKVNMQQVVTQVDGLAKIGRDFGETQAQDEHNAILAVLRGVALSEALNGAAASAGGTGLGGQTFDNDSEDAKYGFYVDLGASKAIVDATTAIQGAARAEGFLRAFGMAYKDYEPEYAYLITSPEVFASLRSANLVDQDRVVDGSISFDTIFQGKFRIIQTRASQGFSTAELAAVNGGAGVDITGTKTSFIVLPGALAMENLDTPVPTEIDRNASSYKGGGDTTIWRRWGYVLAPAGYDWNGQQDAFPSDAGYGSVVRGGSNYEDIVTAQTAEATLATTVGAWTRKTNSALSLGILPVFHS